MEKMLFLFYGKEIEWALRKDIMLKSARRSEGLIFEVKDVNNLTKEENDTFADIRFLLNCGYITPNFEVGYSITNVGQEFLSLGGFTTEAKKNKNAVFAFRISVASLLISIISLLLCFFDRIIRT